jgi:hypothetical protein
MTEVGTRCVAFDGRQVVVASDMPEVLAALETSFRRMLQLQTTPTAVRLEVRRTPHGYILQSGVNWVKSASLDHILSHLNSEVVLRLIGVRPDLIWLHAGAAACGDWAVLVCALSGRGKSTIIASLCDIGWQFLSDDVIPLEPNSRTVFPFPQTPMYRPHPGEEVPPERLHQLRKVEAAIKGDAVCRQAMPVAAVVLPHYDPREPNALTGCSPAAAAVELLRNCLNLTVHRETAFHQLCDVAKALPALRLSFSSGTEGAQLVSQACIEGLHTRIDRP